MQAEKYTVSSIKVSSLLDAEGARLRLPRLGSPRHRHQGHRNAPGAFRRREMKG